MEEKQTFESALARLEKIVRGREEGKLTLEDSLAAFEEGVSLVKFCTGKLDAAEQKVKILLEGENGQLEARDFDPKGARQ